MILLTRQLFFLLIAVVILGAPFYVFAQNNNEEGVGTTTGIIPVATSTIAEADALEEQSTTSETINPVPARGVLPAPNPNLRPALQTRAQERIINLAANISNRMEAAISRLDNVSERLSSRFIKLETESRDMTLARQELQVAKTALAEAAASLSTIDADVVRAITSENPRQGWQSVAATYKNARESILRAHQALRASLTTAKTIASAPLIPNNSSETATSTPES